MRTTLGELLRNPESFPWHHAIYAVPAAPLDADLPVNVRDIDDAGPPGDEYVLDMQTTQSIVANAGMQRDEPTPADLLEAFRHYYDNDAFIRWT